MSQVDIQPTLASQQHSTLKKAGFEEGLDKSFRIRITLTSTKVPALEQACTDLITKAAKKELKARGPIRIPTKVLRITTRKTPCGEGSKTWDRFEMRIHKRVIDLTCTMQDMKEITSIKIESGVDVEVTVAQ
jgi:small subunit ribosomal protein S20e